MAKRVSSSSINWEIIKGRLKNPASLTSVKSKTDKYIKQVTIHPAELPKIDWSQYKKKISVAGVVDSFQKSYESLKIPYPTDQGHIDKISKNAEPFIKKAVEEDADTLKQLEIYKEKLKVLESQMPFSEMTLEEFALACPEYKFDVDNPKLWPQFMPDDLDSKSKE